MKPFLTFTILIAVAQFSDANKIGTFRGRTLINDEYSLTPIDPCITTPLAELARDFDQALEAVNQNKEDINVGKLLKACEKLETTIRNMGFGSSANDIASNMAKIRNTYMKLPPSERDSMPAVLKYELDAGMHPNNKVKEQSATMGFLWLGRSINYQYDMFLHMLDHPDSSPYDAAAHAYCKDVKPHLSWPLQKLGQAALQTVKPMQKQTIMAKLGGFDEEEYGADKDFATKKDLREVMASFSPLIKRLNQVFMEMGFEEL